MDEALNHVISMGVVAAEAPAENSGGCPGRVTARPARPAGRARRHSLPAPNTGVTPDENHFTAASSAKR